MSRPHRVHELLDRKELDALEAFVRDKPGCTVDQAHDWLLTRGYTLSRGAAHNWKRQFDAEDNVRRAAEISRSYLDVAKHAGAADIAAASLQRFQQILFDHLLGAEEADAGELMKLSISLKTAVQSGRQIEEFRKEVAEREQAAVEKAERQAKTGASAGDVIATVKAALGIAA